MIRIWGGIRGSDSFGRLTPLGYVLSLFFMAATYWLISTRGGLIWKADLGVLPRRCLDASDGSQIVLCVVKTLAIISRHGAVSAAPPTGLALKPRSVGQTDRGFFFASRSALIPPSGLTLMGDVMSELPKERLSTLREKIERQRSTVADLRREGHDCPDAELQLQKMLRELAVNERPARCA